MAEKSKYSLDDDEDTPEVGIDLKDLPKNLPPRPNLSEIDKDGQELGFGSREPGKRGRRKSPRTGQIHAKVLPHYAERVRDLAYDRGVTQGIILEEALDLLLSDSDDT